MVFRKGLYFVLALAVLVLMGFMARWALEKGASPWVRKVMKVSEFEGAGEVGVLTFRRLVFDLTDSEVLVLGSHSLLPRSRGLWSAFLTTALNEGWRPDLILQDHGVESISDSVPTIFLDFVSERDRIKEIVAQHLSQGLRVLFYGPAELTAAGEAGSVPAFLKKELGVEAFSLTAVPLVLKAENPHRFSENCKKGFLPYDSVNCLVAFGSMMYSSKAAGIKKWAAASEFHAEKDFIIYIHEPSVP